MLAVPALLLALLPAGAAQAVDGMPGQRHPASSGAITLAQGGGSSPAMPARQPITTVNGDGKGGQAADTAGDGSAGKPVAGSRQADSAADAIGGGSAAGSKAPAGEALRQLRRFAASTRSASGHFVQTAISGRGGASSRGRFAFLRPGNFRWEIESPDQQLIVTDGRKLHFYDKDLQQVTVREAGDAIQATPAAVLFGMGDLEESFTLRELGPRGGVAWIEAVPKSADSGFERIRVGLREGKPVAMEVLDGFGQINRYEFSQLDTKTPVPASQFVFTPPRGVDVLE